MVIRTRGAGSPESWRSSLVSLFAVCRSEASVLRRDVHRSRLDVLWHDPRLSDLASDVHAGILSVCGSMDSARFEREVLRTFRSLLLPTRLLDIGDSKHCKTGSCGSFGILVDDLRRWSAGNGPRPDWVQKKDGVFWPKDPACMTHTSDAIVLAVLSGYRCGWDWVSLTLSDAMVEDDISCGFGARGMLTVLLLAYVLWPTDYHRESRYLDLYEAAVIVNRPLAPEWTLALRDGSTSWWISSVQLWWPGYFRWAANAIADRWLEQLWRPDSRVGRRMVRSLKRRFNSNEDA